MVLVGLHREPGFRPRMTRGTEKLPATLCLLGTLSAFRWLMPPAFSAVYVLDLPPSVVIYSCVYLATEGQRLDLLSLIFGPSLGMSSERTKACVRASVLWSYWLFVKCVNRFSDSRVVLSRVLCQGVGCRVPLNGGVDSCGSGRLKTALLF